MQKIANSCLSALMLLAGCAGRQWELPVFDLECSRFDESALHPDLVAKGDAFLAQKFGAAPVKDHVPWLRSCGDSWLYYRALPVTWLGRVLYVQIDKETGATIDAWAL